MLIEVDRTALYRIGVFSDWIGLAHVLDIPRGSYRIVQSPRQRPGMWRSDCAWRRLEPMTPPSSPTEICWSVRWGLPLEIATDGEIGGGKPRFSIREVRTFASEANIFDIAREGLLEIDAASDGEISD